MAAGETKGGLFAEAPQDEALVVVNGRVQLRTADGHRVVTVHGGVLAHFKLGDRMAEAHAMVSLVEQGWAEQLEVAKAFGRSERSVRRYQRRFEVGGLAALGRPDGFPKGRPRLSKSWSSHVVRLKQRGDSNREVARVLGVSEKSIRKVLRREGWVERAAVQQPLPFAGGADPNLSGQAAPTPEVAAPKLAAGADPNLSGEPAESGFSLDAEAADRSLDRLLAFLG
jgi:transposase